MSIVDLNIRLTSNWNTFTLYSTSSDSLIFLEGEKLLPNDSLVSLDLCVGQRWWDHKSGTFYSIPEDGLSIRSHSSAVIEVAQKLAVPSNVFGFVTGKGRFIYRGVLISPGKIDPGFNGRLRIGVYNTGSDSLLLRRGMPFCSCCFVSTETTVQVLPPTDSQPHSLAYRMPIVERCMRIWKQNWKIFLPIIISVVSLCVTVAIHVLYRS